MSRICASNLSRSTFAGNSSDGISFRCFSVVSIQKEDSALASNDSGGWHLHLLVNCDVGPHNHELQASEEAKFKITGLILVHMLQSNSSGMCQHEPWA